MYVIMNMKVMPAMDISSREVKLVCHGNLEFFCGTVYILFFYNLKPKVMIRICKQEFISLHIYIKFFY